jgi:hypothetical protein
MRRMRWNCCLLPLALLRCAVHAAKPVNPRELIREVSATELLANADYWTQDYVVMVDDGDKRV